MTAAFVGGVTRGLFRQPLGALAGLALPCLWLAVLALDPARIGLEKPADGGWIHEFAFMGAAIGVTLSVTSLARLASITSRLDPTERLLTDFLVLLCAGAVFAVIAVLPAAVVSVAAPTESSVATCAARLGAVLVALAAAGALALRCPLPARWVPWTLSAAVVALVPVSIARPDPFAQACVASGFLIAAWLADRRIAGSP